MGLIYKTLSAPAGPSIYKEKGSKFLGYAFPVENKTQIKEILQKIKKEHHGARHWCYAYRINPKNPEERAYDDGEPTYSAGKPILQQIQQADLMDVLVVVVRYFGGVKLGVGGLIQAYRTAAKTVLDSAKTVNKEIKEMVILHFDYEQINLVMQFLKRYQIKPEKMETGKRVNIIIKADDEIISLFEKTLPDIKINKIKSEL